MNKYRAILMVPTVVEFKNQVGSRESVTDQAKQIADSRGKAASIVREHTYTPTVVECARLTSDDSKSNLDLAEEVKKPL